MTRWTAVIGPTWRRLGVCAALALAAGTVAAGPYTLGVSQSVTHETNLLRVEDGQRVPDSLSRADRVYTSSVQGGIDQPIGRQRLFGQAQLRHTRFERNRIYDNSGYRLHGGLDWATVQQLSGTVGATLQRSLAQFSNDEAGILTRSNIERTQQAESAVRWGVSARLAAEASLNWRRVDYSAPEFASREFNQGSAYLGWRHAPSGALWWSLGWRQSRGEYPNFRPLGSGFEGDRFERQDLELKANFKPTGSSEFDGRLGLGRTRYDTATSRDITGLYGALAWHWRPSGRLRLQSRWSRDPSQDSYFQSTPLFGRGTLSYDRVATTVQLRADYELTGKTALHAAWGWTDRSLVRSITVGAGTLDDVRSDDRTQQYTLGLRWQPMRTLAVGLDLSGESRHRGSVLSRPYRSTSISTYGQLSLD